MLKFKDRVVYIRSEIDLMAKEKEKVNRNLKEIQSFDGADISLVKAISVLNQFVTNQT